MDGGSLVFKAMGVFFFLLLTELLLAVLSRDFFLGDNSRKALAKR
jgi:hypothetical protein